MGKTSVITRFIKNTFENERNVMYQYNKANHWDRFCFQKCSTWWENDEIAVVGYCRSGKI